MTSYLFFWGLGPFLGALAGIAVEHRRRCLTLANAGALGVACGGLFVGAKMQYRLEFSSTVAAFSVVPADILDAGFRLPLGIALGAVMALGWCRWLRLPWRDTGDALAVAAMTALPIGRIGCVLNGCCLGKVCPSWARSFCMTPAPGSEAVALQVSMHQIDGSSPQPLPVIPLPWLFAASSVAILVILMLQLRRNAVPGTMLATACALGPLAKAALETLRGLPRPPGLMIEFPLATSAVAVAILIMMRIRRPRVSMSWSRHRPAPRRVSRDEQVVP